jgi:lysophospholipase L1-like esterase
MIWIWVIAIIFLGSILFWGYKQYERYLVNEDPTFWEREILRIEKRYGSEYPQDVVVCYGSSSIRFWKNIADDLAPIPVVNHGFGGSKLPDATYYIDRMVLPFSPKAVLLFSGTNDLSLAKGNTKTGEDVYTSFVEFAKKLRETSPNLPLFYITITPTRARWKIWPEAKKANQLIEKFASGENKIILIDPTEAFLDTDGLPRKEYFRFDRLHPNKQGYTVWTSIIRPVLMETLGY